ncbi:methyltransferase-like protein 27 isoform X2 [Chiloscyllium punctatum]|uniref:methyltransferase-like protein 27 isoform X2 n=1 Tax=Chiloscyllium punctatum TaxID=137246 RepID=UPI003B63BB1E
MEKPGIDVVNARLLTLYSNMETKEKVNFYDSWAQDYEQHMTVMDYQAPRFSVETLDAVYLGDRDSALVLDVPCGTGLVAETLQKLGFKHFHGIEGSKQMLKIAESKDSYDLVMIVGGLAQQHLPWEILPEMLRVTKSDGFICFTLRAEESDHRRNLLTSIQELVNKGLWENVVERYVEKWQRDMLPTGLAEEYADGIVTIYRKK